MVVILDGKELSMSEYFRYLGSIYKGIEILTKMSLIDAAGVAQRTRSNSDIVPYLGG